MVLKAVFKGGFPLSGFLIPHRLGFAMLFGLAEAVNEVKGGKQNHIRNPATIRARGLKLLKRSLSPYIYIFTCFWVFVGETHRINRFNRFNPNPQHTKPVKNTPPINLNDSVRKEILCTSL